MLNRIKIQNFRSLANVDLKVEPLNILFGPNGAGKSTFLDAIWFVRDCVIRGVDEAASERNHGIGLLWDGADEGANISIMLETASAQYEILFGFSSGRIEPHVGEVLQSKNRDIRLIDRKIGHDKADFYVHESQQIKTVALREPANPALVRYIDFEQNALEAQEVDRQFHVVHFYRSHAADLSRLKKFGSESSYQIRLSERGQNLWSVLRNLHDRRVRDERYDTIVGFMKQSFPAFTDLLIEQTGPNTVYGNFIENGLRHPVKAAGVSDGHLQMLINLTALFTDEKESESLILFDEPEASLHPHALAILAKAVKHAVEKWNKQIFIATHSPVLISQFESENVLAAEINKSGQTVLKRVSEMDEIKDLLAEYATGSLYMAELIAPQSKPLVEEIVQ